MVSARTVLYAVVMIVALGMATIVTLAYPNPNVAKFAGWTLLFVVVRVPVLIIAAATHHTIRIADRDSM